MDEDRINDVFEKLEEVAQSLMSRQRDIEEIRNDVHRQSEEMARQSSQLSDIRATLSELKGTSYIERLKDLERAVLRPEGIVDQLRIQNAKEVGRAKAWAMGAAALGTIATLISLLKAMP